MIYLLDANTCIKFLNGQSDTVRRHDRSLAAADTGDHSAGALSRVASLDLEDWE